jgi:hypothetical protein
MQMTDQGSESGLRTATDRIGGFGVAVEPSQDGPSDVSSDEVGGLCA